MDLYGVENQQPSEQCFLLKAPDTRGVTLRRDSVTCSRAQRRYRDGSEPLRSRDSNTTTATTHQVGRVWHLQATLHYILNPQLSPHIPICTRSHFSLSLSAHFLSLSPVRGNRTTADLTSPVFLPTQNCQVTKPLFFWHTEKIPSNYMTTALLCLHSTDEFLPLCWGKTWRSAGLGSESHAGSEHRGVEQLGTTTDENVAASVDSVLQQSQFSGQYSKLTMIEFYFE